MTLTKQKQWKDQKYEVFKLLKPTNPICAIFLSNK